MPTPPARPVGADAHWHKLLVDGHRPLRIAHWVFRHLPSPPRCKVCHNPFGGVGGKLVGLAGFSPSRKNPNLCSRCCDSMPPGGAELDIAVLFADVRGSTSLGERLALADYAALMNWFYHVATEVLVRHDAIIDKLIGDEVMALFVPGICGRDYRRHAADAAFALLRAVGYGGSAASPRLPLGAAVHSGLAYVGNVGGSGVSDFTALGDVVNTAARLAASATAGEVILSEPVYETVRERLPRLAQRTVELRGKGVPLAVRVHDARRAR